jgi:lauroyl/myristoyl acyltransferase
LRNHEISFFQHIAFVLEAVLVIPLGNLAAFLPWKTGKFMAAHIGLLLFHLSRKARQQADRNLDIIYASKRLSSVEKERIIRKLFINMASSAYEYLKIGHVTESNYLDFVRFENPEPFLRGGQGKEGFIVVSAHLGNWEFLGSIAAKLGWNLGAVIHRQSNPYTDRWLRRIREKGGKIKCYYDEISAMRRMFSHLRKGGTLAILADERHTARPVHVPFFGRLAATPEGPAKLHLLFGSSIVFCFSIKEDDGKYLLTHDGPYVFKKTGNLKKDCEDVMRHIYQKYETVIRNHPDQWFSLLTPRWE